jgi:hypothetical protein
MSTGPAPLRPTVLLLTATAVKRSRGAFEAVCAPANGTQASSAAAAAALTNRR